MPLSMYAGVYSTRVERKHSRYSRPTYGAIQSIFIPHPIRPMALSQPLQPVVSRLRTFVTELKRTPSDYSRKSSS